MNSYGYGENNSVNGALPSENEKLASETWVKFLDIFRHSVSELKLKTWFRPIRAKSISGNTLTLLVPSQDTYLLSMNYTTSIYVFCENFQGKKE